MVNIIFAKIRTGYSIPMDQVPPYIEIKVISKQDDNNIPHDDQIEIREESLGHCYHEIE